MNISANNVKTLREQTGAGMLDCKKALTETNGDMEKAVDWLRQKGLSAAAKKSGRTAAEGLVGIMMNDQEAVMVEINAETDFVARNEKFQTLMKKALEGAMAMEGDDLSQPLQEKLQNDTTELIATIGENMALRRARKLKGDILASYIHNSLNPQMGKIGVVVSLSGNGDKNILKDVGKKLAMHIAAQNPQYLNNESVPQEALKREEAVLTEQAKESGKPDAVIKKMVEGRMKKFFEEVVLLEQSFILDEEGKKIADWLKTMEKDVGSPIAIKDFLLFRLGEGIEKKEDNFADEVASMTKQ